MERVPGIVAVRTAQVFRRNRVAQGVQTRALIQDDPRSAQPQDKV